MPEELEIRLPTAADLDAIARLEAASFPAPWRREFFESELDASGRFHLVALRAGRLIGYVFAMWFYDEMHINKIAVDAAERRKGIARLLMDRCIGFGREHQIATISLEVRQSNRAAQAFYATLAFRAAYVRPRYYPDGEGAVVMMLSLG